MMLVLTSLLVPTALPFSPNEDKLYVADTGRDLRRKCERQSVSLTLDADNRLSWRCCVFIKSAKGCRLGSGWIS